MSDSLAIDTTAPDFALPADDGTVISLREACANGPVLLFFYPGDFTPVCTAEVCAFRDDYPHFASRGVTILGISSDPVERHQRFAEHCRVPFRLLSDVGLDVARLYGARGMLGMRRAYYIIDRSGILRWQHAEILPIFRLSNSKMLEAIDALDGAIRQKVPS